MKLVSIFGDTHLTPVRGGALGEDSLFPGFFQALPDDVRDSMWREMCELLQRCTDEVLAHPSFMHDQNGPLDAIFCMGDVTGGHRGKGLFSQGVISLAESLISSCQSKSKFFGMTWGGHCVGYRGGMLNEEGRKIVGKLNIQSLRTCQNLSPLFWSHVLEDVCFVGICSPLLQPYELRGAEEVDEMRKKQADFVVDTLERHGDRPWVLCTHDLNYIGDLARSVGAYSHNLIKIVVGHVHGKVGERFERVKMLFSSFSGYHGSNLVVCPSVAPLWWQGGSCVTGVVDGDTFTTETYLDLLSSALRERVNASPFSSFSKALFACRHDLGNWRNAF